MELYAGLEGFDIEVIQKLPVYWGIISPTGWKVPYGSGEAKDDKNA